MLEADIPKLHEAMLASPSPGVRSVDPRRPVRVWAGYGCLVVIFLCWMLPGIIGREPWKPDEAYTLGLVKHVAESGDWVVPQLAGEPFMEKPPLFYIVAATLGRWLAGSWLSFHEAARLACVVFILIALAAQAGLARLARRPAAVGCLALLGSLGLLIHAHQLITDLALLAGCALGLYGMSLGLASLDIRRIRLGGALLGLGVGVAFLAKGLLGPGMLAVTLLLLLLLERSWQPRAYRQFLAVALIVSAPFLIIWPWCLWHADRQLFDEWLWVNNFGRFLGTVNLGPRPPAGGYLGVLLWFALPAWPFACLALWQDRKSWRVNAVPLLYCMVGLAVLMAAADARELYALPLLPGVCALAARAELPTVPRWLTMLVWGLGCLLLAMLWLGWLEMVDRLPHALSLPWQFSLHRPRHLSPFLRLVSVRPGDIHPSPASAWLALVISLGWVLYMYLPIHRGAQGWWARWAAAVAAIWAVFMLLYLPWLAVGNDYRHLAHTIATRTQALRPACVASEHLGEPQRALFDYYEGWRSERVELGAGMDCPLRLVQHSALVQVQPMPSSWALIWRGCRPGCRGEWFELYQRRDPLVPFPALPTPQQTRTAKE